MNDESVVTSFSQNLSRQVFGTLPSDPEDSDYASSDSEDGSKEEVEDAVSSVAADSNRTVDSKEMLQHSPIPTPSNSTPER